MPIENLTFTFPMNLCRDKNFLTGPLGLKITQFSFTALTLTFAFPLTQTYNLISSCLNIASNKHDRNETYSKPYIFFNLVKFKETDKVRTPQYSYNSSFLGPSCKELLLYVLLMRGFSLVSSQT